MAYARESSTDKHLNYPGDAPDIDALKRPDWVNLTSLDPQNDTLFDKLLYKPALRFHGLTGGLWGQGLSGPQSVITESRPPSYKVKDPLAATYLNDASTTYDQSSLHNNAVSRLTLRKRNTIAVVLVAVALLAAIAAVTGVILHFMHPKALLRANVRFTVANLNFTEEMLNKSSVEFNAIKRPLCGEMDIYFLTSELADFYFGCKVVSLSKTKDSDNVAVHYTLDFLENKVTNNKERIKRVILNKSGRHQTNDTLFLIIDDFWVYLRSLRVDLETVPMDKRPQRPWIPWRNDIDFINRESNRVNDSFYTPVLLKRNEPNQSVVVQSSFTNTAFVLKDVLPNIQKDNLPLLTNRVYTHAFNVDTRLKALIVSSNVLSVYRTPVLFRDYRIQPNLDQEHTYAPVQPTKALNTESSIIEGQFMEINEIPIAREFKALRQERIEKKIESKDINQAKDMIINKQRNVAIRVNDRGKGVTRAVLPLETSFNPITTISSNSVTESLSTHMNKMSQKVNYGDVNFVDKKRVVTIYSDVFLIVGSELQSDNLFAGTIEPLDTTPVKISSSINGDMSNVEFAMQSRSFSPVLNFDTQIVTFQKQTNAIYNSLSLKSVSQQVNVLQLIPHKLKETVARHGSHRTHVSSQKLSKSPGVDEIKHVSATVPRFATLNPDLEKVGETKTLTDKIELKEILVQNPVQRMVPVGDNIPEDIQWINILTLPERVTSIPVDRTTDQTGRTDSIFDVNNIDNTANNIHLTAAFGRHVIPLNHSSNQDSEASTQSDSSEPNSELLAFPREEFNFATSSESDVLLPANIDSSGEQLSEEATIITKQTNPKPTTDSSNEADSNSRDTVFNPQGTFSRSSHTANHVNKPNGPWSSINGTHDAYFNNSSPSIIERHHTLFKINSNIPRAFSIPKIQTSSHPRKNKFFMQGKAINGILTNHQGLRTQNSWGIGGGTIARHSAIHRENDIHDMFNYRQNTDIASSNLRRTNTVNIHYRNSHNKKDIYYAKVMDRPPSEFPSKSEANFRASNVPNILYRKSALDVSNWKWYRHPVIYYDSGYPSKTSLFRNMNSHFLSRKRYLIAKSSNVWTNKMNYNKHIKPLWKNVVVPWTYFHTGGSIYGRYRDSYAPYYRYSKHRISAQKHSQPPYGYFPKPFVGLTESYNISDIYEMKETLTDLIDAMQNMSNKLEKMQAAINFINQTLHETKQPIHKLENTFENMTRSFDNFNRNLNDITDILSGFKTFLRPFKNTIFNIDDIIEHIDRTVNNLDKTRTYVGVSMNDLSDSVNSVTGTLSDLNSSLKHVNMSVFHVNNTAKYTNKTLESMEKTLESLDSAIRNMNLKIDGVKGNIEGINISLSTINKTVETSHDRLVGLQSRLNEMNGTVKRIKDNVERLNDTYTQINETLRNMNEPIMVTEGTVLEVIDKLVSIDSELFNISTNMRDLGVKVDLINDSLDATLQWMGHMLQALNKFNVTIETSNDTISVSLKNIDIVDTVGILLKLNKTLYAVEDHITKSKINIDIIDFSLNELENNLIKLEHMLENMDHTFSMLNETLKDVNSTLHEVRHPLKTINENIERINYSFEDLDETFDNINKTLEIANRTLVKVNTTRDEINKTLYQVKDKLNTTDTTITRVNTSIMNLNNSLEFLNGPLEKIKDELYYTNQTFKVIKDQVNNTVTFFTNVKETLNEINGTLGELVTNLKETQLWLKRTNTSLKDVNATIEAIQGTYEEMSETLNTLYSSFNSTVTSLQDFRTAFPTLRKKVIKTAKEIAHVQNQIQKIYKSLSRNYLKRNDSVNNYNDMMSLFEAVQKSIQHEIDAFREAVDFSVRVENNIAELVDHAGSTEQHLNKIERNVNILDNALDNLKQEHSLSLDESSHLTEMIQTTNESLLELEEKKADVFSLANAYPLLRIPKDKIDSIIGRQRKVLNETNGSISFWEPTLENIAGTLWDGDGNPINIHDEPDNITQAINVINATLKEFDAFAINASELLKGILDNKNTLTIMFNRINSTAIKIDEIGAATARINDELNSTEKTIERNSDNLVAFENELNDKTSKLKELRREYEKVNGTSAVLEKFSAVEDLINMMESQIQSLTSQTKNASYWFLEANLKYKLANDSFYGTPVSVDDEGEFLIKNTLDALNETESILGTIDGQLVGIKNANGHLSASMMQLDRYTEALDEHLKKKTQHYNFVETNRPALKNAFLKVNNDFKTTTDTLNELKARLIALHSSAQSIENRSVGMTNVDMSIDGETRLLKALEMSVSELKNEVDIAFQKCEAANKSFQLFNHSEKEIRSVQKEYSKYQNLLKNLDRVLATVDIEASVIDRRINDILLEFGTISAAIEDYYATVSDLDEIERKLDSMRGNMNDTSDQMHRSELKVKDVTGTLGNIKEMFANFLEASFNISDLPVNNEVREMLENFANISRAFNDQIQNGNITLSTFRDTKNKLLTAPLSRYNVSRVIFKDIHSSSTRTIEDIKSVNSSLNDIKSRLGDLNIHVHFINNSLQINNERLFIDKQKKHMADKEFPDLEHAINELSNLLRSTMASMKSPFREYNTTLNAMDNVFGIIDTMPTIDISDLAHRNAMTNVSDILKNTMKELKLLSDLLVDANNTIWTDDDKRYSHRESISDISNRYANAANDIREIHEGLSELQANTAMAEGSLSNISTSLHTLNSSLSAFQNLDDNIQDLATDINLQRYDTKQIRSNMNSTEKSLSLLDKKLKDTTDRFSHINQAVLQNGLHPIDINVSYNKEKFQNSLETLGYIERSIDNHSRTINDMLDVIFQTITDQTSLDDIINSINDSLIDLTPKVTSSKEKRKMLEKRIDPMGDELLSISSDLDDVRTNLYRQEKKEFYEEFFKPTSYNDVGGRIKRLNMTNDVLNILLNEGVFAFKNLIETLNETDNVDLNLEEIVDILDLFNKTLTKNAEVINDMTVIHNDTIKYFHSEDGAKFNDNETIEELKKRFDRLNTTLQFINNQLTGVESNQSQHMFDILKNQNENMTNIKGKLYDFQETSNTLKDLYKKANALNSSLVNVQSKSHERARIFQKVREDLEFLEMSFPGVHNNNINSTKDHIKTIQTMLGNAINSVQSEIRSDAEDFKVLSKYIEDMFVKYENGFKDIETIEIFLRDFNNIKVNTQAELSDINQSVLHSDDKIQTHNLPLKDLQNSVDLLRSQLLQQEKRNFIETKAPHIQNKLQILKGDLHKIIENLSSKQDSVNMLHDVLDVVEGKINNNSLIDISLVNVTEIVQSTERGLFEEKNIMSTLNEALNAINTDMFNPDGGYFGDDDSLATVQTAYDTVNETIRSANKSLTGASHYVSTVEKLTHGTEHYLAELLKEFDRGKEITARTEILTNKDLLAGNDLKKVGDNLSNIDSDIMKLDKMLQSIKNRFWNVSDPTLLHETAEIESAIRNVFENHAKSVNDLNDMKYQKLQSKINIEKLEDNLKRVSPSLNELKKNHRTSENVISNISPILNDLDQQLKNSFEINRNLINDTKFLLEKLDDLEFKYTEKQMNQFVNATFPSILENIDTFENILQKLSHNISDVLGQRDNIFIKMQETRVKADRFDLNASLKDLSPIHDAISEDIHDAKAEQKRLKEELHKFVWSLNSDISYNDTLQNISKRFQHYNNTLKEMFDRVTPIDESIRHIKSLSHEANSKLNKYDVQIGEYGKVGGRLNRHKTDAEAVERQIIKTASDLRERDFDIKMLQVQMDYIGETFRHVNNSDLEEMKQVIQSQISDLKGERNLLEDKLNNLKANINTVGETVKNELAKAVSHAPNLNHLQTLSDLRETLAKTVENDINTSDAEITFLSDDIMPQIKSYINKTSNLITELKNKYEEEKKRDYIKENLPNILNEFTLLNKSLAINKDIVKNLNSKIVSLNRSMHTLDGKMRDISNVFIPLRSLKYDIYTGQQNVGQLSSILDGRQDKLDNVYIHQLTPKKLQSLPMKEIKDKLNNLKTLFNDTNESMHFVSNTLKTTNDTVNENEQTVQETNVLLSRYERLANASQYVGDRLSEVNNSIDGTSSFLTNVKENFEKYFQKFRNIEQEFDGVKNSDIDHLYGKAKALVNMVDLRLPLVSDLYNNKTLSGFDGLSNKYKRLQNNINSLITDNARFKEVLDSSESQISNISNNINSLMKDERQYAEEGLLLAKQLDKFNDIIIELERSLKAQRKRELLEQQLPLLKSHFQDISDTTYKLNSSLITNLENVEIMNFTLQTIDKDINNKPSLQIPLDDKFEYLHKARHSLKGMKTDLLEAKEKLNKLPIYEVDIENIIANESLSLADVEGIISRMKSPLLELDRTLSKTRNGNGNIVSTISDMKHDALLLQETLNDFIATEHKIKTLDSDIEGVETKQTLSAHKLKVANASIDSLKAALEKTKVDFPEYNPDDRRIQSLLQNVESQFENIKHSFEKASGVLEGINDEFSEINSTLYRTSKSRHQLNRTLNTLRERYQGANKSLSKVNVTFNDLIYKFSPLDNALAMIDAEIKQLNNSLKREEDKSLYINETLPELKKKYQETNFTISVMNKTFQEMESKLKSLEKFVEKVKSRMDLFQNINISMSNMTSNLTEMENRIFIMKEHYNNIKDIVSNLQNDLEAGSQFGENVSLQDITNVFSSYNLSIDKVDEVLGKIDMEFIDMDDHFVYLNETLVDIDTALDEYEERAMETELMNEDINDLSNTLTKKDEKIHEMKKTVNKLNGTFANLKNIYTDVFTTTSNQNAMFKETLSNASSLVESVQQMLKNLSAKQEQLQKEYNGMNETLRQDINSANTFHDVLAEVQLSYDSLIDDLDILFENVSKAQNHTKELNSLLNNVGTILNDINDTLHAEQNKYNYITSNLGIFGNKLYQIDNGLRATKQSLLGTESSLMNATSFVSNVKTRMLDYPSVHFDINNKTLDSVDKGLSGMNNLFNDMNKTFIEMKSSISQSEDSVKNMSELNSRYFGINDTLETLKHGIAEMKVNVSVAKNETDHFVDEANQIMLTLDTFDKVEAHKNYIRNGLDKLSSNKSNFATEVGSIATIQDTIGDKIGDLNRMYKHVETAKSGQMKNKLSDLTDEFQGKVQQLENLQKAFRDFSENFTSVNDNSKYLERLLQTPLYSFDQLRYVTNNSEQIIPDILNGVTDVQKGAELLNSLMNELKADVVDLDTRINTLNQSLFEEKQKQEFINNKFKLLNQTFIELHGEIEYSNGTIALTLARTAGISDDLTQLSLKLDRFSAMNISLDSENNIVQEERNRIEELLKIYANVSESHKQLQVDNLKNTNKSFDKIKQDYEVFENEMKRLENSLSRINESVTETNNRLSGLSTAISDINDTVDNYEQMERIISDQTDKSRDATNALNHSKVAASELEKEIDYLNKWLIKLENTFSQINDPKLKSAKDNLENMLRKFSEDLNELRKNNREMDSLTTGIKQRFDSVNNTMYSTKKMLDTLKEHIQVVNQSSVLLANDLRDVESKQLNANNTAAGIKPGLDRILKELQNLSSAFDHEQDKFDFITKNKPVLEADYRNLEADFNDINKRISLTDLQLADLRYTIKTTDAKLQTFKTLDITTKPEMDAWSERSNKINDLSSRFVRLGSKYNLLKEDIQNLNMNSTEGELKDKVDSINKALTDIKVALQGKNDSLKAMKEENSKADAILDDLTKTMKQFKNLQTNGLRTKEQMESTLAAISNSSEAIKKVTLLKTLIDGKIHNMDNLYSSVIDTAWSRELSTLKFALSFEKDKLNLNMKNIGSIEEVMNTTAAAFNDTYRKLMEQPLNRNNVKNMITMLDRNIRTMKLTFTDTDGQIKNADKDISHLYHTLNDIWNKLSTLNESLFLEWEKASYVNDTLPELQQKLMLVNGTFAANLPSSNTLKTQVSYLTVILENIEQKMKLYGIEDTDNSVNEWRKMIANLNKTVTNIIEQNEQSDQTLVDLRVKLWSDKPMYTRPEGVTDVRRRFEEFNRTLDDISLSSHSVNLKLKLMNINSSDIASQMENRDAMLTTTTTPSSAPDWLSFTSSGTGTIAVDRGMLECSATELNNWDVMTITRVNPNGKKQVMAAWKQGVGAKKPRAFRDRRVRVRRTLGNNGGGKLQVGISKIQCVDEATYLCAVDTHHMWPLKTKINVMSPPEDSMEPDFPTEVFEDKVANFSCTGRPGYPNGRITWKVRHGNEAFFKDFDFYSAKSKVADEKCTRTETNTVGYQFDMKWNSTRIRCYIENTNFYGEGIIRILPYSICNNVRDLGKIRHPYTPHKYIVCDRGLNIMQCPGNTCYDQTEENCVQCKASVTGGDPCRGQPLFSYVAHETHCSKYYICMGPTKSTKTCAKGYFAKNAPGHCVMRYSQSECAKKKG